MEHRHTRQGYADALVELGRENPSIVVLDSDVSVATKTCDFEKVFPDRFFNCGVQEQDMLSVAAGMALEGLVPFATTFGIFATARAGDQLRSSIAYPKANVKVAAEPQVDRPLESGRRHRRRPRLLVVPGNQHRHVR